MDEKEAVTPFLSVQSDSPDGDGRLSHWTDPAIHLQSMSSAKMPSRSTRTVAIVGGGPVGALAALYFSKRFSQVTLYELRPGLPRPASS